MAQALVHQYVLKVRESPSGAQGREATSNVVNVGYVYDAESIAMCVVPRVVVITRPYRYPTDRAVATAESNTDSYADSLPEAEEGNVGRCPHRPVP